MLDLVAQVNSSLLMGIVIEANEKALLKMVDKLLELNAGSTAYMIGLFLGHTASRQMKDSGSTPAERAWFGASKLIKMATEMALDENGQPHAQDVIVEKVAPFFDYLKPLLDRIKCIVNDAPDECLKEEEAFRTLAILIGDPSLKNNKAPKTYEEFKLLLALRVQDTFMTLLTVASRTPHISDLPLGEAYVDFYSQFLANTNRYVLPNVDASHAINGRQFPLFDCRYVPGFGFQGEFALSLLKGIATTTHLGFSSVTRIDGVDIPGQLLLDVCHSPPV